MIIRDHVCMYIIYASVLESDHICIEHSDMQLVALAFSLLWCELGIPGLGAHCSLCTSDFLRINPSPQQNSMCCAAAYMCKRVEVSNVSNLFQCQEDVYVGFSNGLME